MVNCRQAVRQLGELLDQSLGPGEREQVAAHLRRCPACAAFVVSYQKTTQLCRRELFRQAPAELTARVLDMVRRHGRSKT